MSINTTEINPELLTVTDVQNDLTVINYKDGVTDAAALNVRGIIKNSAGEVVCKSFGYTPEVLANDGEKLNALISPLICSETRVFKSYEGTIMRVWNYAGKWLLSSHRKVDASKSKWGHTQSFGDLFRRALKNISFSSAGQEGDIFELYCNTCLNPDKIYVFMMTSFAENRKVCMYGPEPCLFIIGAFERNNEFRFCQTNAETLCNPPEEVDGITDSDGLLQAVNDMDPMVAQGIVLMNPDGSSGKIVSLQYDQLDKLRGNEPNVLYRYVQLRWKPESLENFKKLYPEHQAKFDQWEQAMQHITNNIFRKYIERYVHRNTSILPPDQYPVMVQLHGKYIHELRPQGKRVEPAHVWELLGTWSEREVNQLYKAYKYRESVTGNGNRMPEEVRQNIVNYLNSKSSNAGASN
jgi:hypothetical protein